MALYRDEGLVLRSIKLGEADRIVTILTRDHGRIRAVAKGVRRLKSRFGGRLEPFMRDDLLIATGRSLDVVSQASTISPYAARIVGDYDVYVSANMIVEIADRLFAALDEPAPAQYRLAVGAVSALARRLHAPHDVAASYTLRALALAGWRPRLDSCVVCGGGGDLTAFSVPAGGLMCSADRTPDAWRVSDYDRWLLGAWLRGDWAALDRGHGGAGNDAPEPRNPERALEIVGKWAEYYLERPIRSARLLD